MANQLMLENRRVAMEWSRSISGTTVCTSDVRRWHALDSGFVVVDEWGEILVRDGRTKGEETLRAKSEAPTVTAASLNAPRDCIALSRDASSSEAEDDEVSCPCVDSSVRV